MEEVSKRFPLIARSILKVVNEEDLINCKESSRDISQFLDEERFFFIRIIQKHQGNFVEFQESWKKVVNKAPFEVLRRLAIAIRNFFKPESSRFENQWPPFWLAIEVGDFQLCKFITEKEILTHKGVTTAQAGNLELQLA